MAVESIVAAVDAQYVEELKEDYVSYKNQPINTMIEQLQTCYVITTKYKIAIKVHFLKPWSDMPDACATTFDRQLDRRQVECKNHGVKVTKED